MTLATRILAIALIIPHISTLAAKCFLPDGRKDDNDQPCFVNDTLSRCCAPDEVCSTNKLCVSVKNGGNKFARGSCLDAAFGGTCPDFCKGIKDSGKVDVYQCGDPALGQFCCDEGKGLGSSCCSTSSNIITLGLGITFSEGASTTIMSSMSRAPFSILPLTSATSQKATSLGFVTSIISQAPLANRPSASTIPNSSSRALSASTLISLVSSLIVPASTFSQIPTTLPGEFTNLPSPVFTSIFVPTSTLAPQRTTRSKSSSSSPFTTPSIILPSSSLTRNQTSSTSHTALPAASASASASTSAPLIPTPQRLNSQAIIAGTVGGAVAVFLVTFFVILFKQQQKRKSLPASTPFARDKENKTADEKGSIRSMRTDSSNQTAFGYKPEPKRNMSERSDDNGNNISVPIVFRSETPYESIRSADIRSIEERIQRMSGTTFRSGGVTSPDTRRMTPGSDFNVYQSPNVSSPTTMTERSRSREALEGNGERDRDMDRDSYYVDERELATFGFTPEDLNKVGGTGYGQGSGGMVLPMELTGMEGRIPDRISGLSERSTTYQKLLYDVQSKPF